MSWFVEDTDWEIGVTSRHLFGKTGTPVLGFSYPVLKVRRETRIMAKITPEDVDHIAGLAQLTVDDETRQRLVVQLNDILAYIDKLNELDTTGIEPMMHAVPMTNVFRDDVVGESLDREKALMNAPKTDGEYFLVPRILDQE